VWPVEDLNTYQSLLYPQKSSTRHFRALDVGAGIGRVTADTLLPLVHDVVLLEPVESLLRAAVSQGHASAAQAPSRNESRLPLQKWKWKGISDIS
jgi:protein N-terminal methyltransferase